jgi:DNA-directed RNA polymerase specialized sigma54-like protein
MTTHNYPTIAAVLYELDQLIDENESLKIRIQELESNKASTHWDNLKKLNKREVKEIKSLHRVGESQRAIADIYDVNPSTISRIVRGQYWKSA